MEFCSRASLKTITHLRQSIPSGIYKDRNSKNRYRTHTLSKRTLLFPLYQPRRERENPLFYWVKCTSLFLAIEERESERKERIGANRSIQNEQQRGFLFVRNAKTPLKHWGFLKSKRTTSRWLSLFALRNWRRGRDSNPRTLAGQRFSRPPLSTTQPPLQNSSHLIKHKRCEYYIKIFGSRVGCSCFRRRSLTIFAYSTNI